MTWKKVIVSGSQAHLKSLSSDGPFIVEAGTILFNDLPTDDPHVAGRLWSNNKFLYVSLG